MCSPGQHWFLLWIVVRIIILRNLWIQSFSHISLILGIQCHSIILRMSHYKDLTSILRHAKINSCFFRICKNCDSVIFSKSSCGTSVCLECGARNLSSNPLTIGIFLFLTWCQNKPERFSGSCTLSIP